MQTLNQTILNGMIEKAINLLVGSSLHDAHLVALLRKVPVTINYRMRTAGGRVGYTRQPYTRAVINISVEINYEYALLAMEDEVQNTVSHELAHAYHILLTGSTDHGSQWQRIHLAMGGTAERCHNVEVRKNNVQRHKILDSRNGKTYNVTTRKWNTIKDWTIQGNPVFTKVESFIKGQQPAMA